MKTVFGISACIIVTVSILISCRKQEVISSEFNSAKFFNLNSSVHTSAKRIADTIMQQAKNGNFLSRIIREEGIPVWDKAEIVVNSQVSDIKNNDTTVIIPLVLENTRYVNTILFCKVAENKVDIYMVQGRYYHMYAFGKSDISITADIITAELMYFDYKLFKDSVFIINDNRLFQSINSSANRESPNLSTTPPVVPVIPAPALAGRPDLPNCLTPLFVTTDGAVLGVIDPTCKPVIITVTSTSATGPGTGSSTGTTSNPVTIGSGGSAGGNPNWSTSICSDQIHSVPPPAGYSYPPPCTTVMPVTPIVTASQNVADEKEIGLTDSDANLAWWDDNKRDPNTVYTQQARPNYQKMYNSYPKNADGTSDLPTPDVCKIIGGEVLAEHNKKPIANSCALRVSRALNYSGINIPSITGQTGKGADGKNYFYRVEHLFNWMGKTFGPADIHLTAADGVPNGTKFKDKLGGLQNRGIYMMRPKSQATFGATGHATLWGGLDCIGGRNFFAAASDIYIWKLPQ